MPTDTSDNSNHSNNDPASGASSLLSTVSGPSTGTALCPAAATVRKSSWPCGAGSAQKLAALCPANSSKPGEYGDAARHPQTGEMHLPDDVLALASTASEAATSAKLGDTPAQGVNRSIGPLDQNRADGSEQALSSNQGVAIGDNQNSLKAGIRGPALLEDFC
jgi:catalase